MKTTRRLIAIAMVAAADKLACFFGKIIAAQWQCPCSDEKCMGWEK